MRFSVQETCPCGSSFRMDNAPADAALMHYRAWVRKHEFHQPPRAEQKADQ